MLNNVPAAPAVSLELEHDVLVPGLTRVRTNCCCRDCEIWFKKTLARCMWQRVGYCMSSAWTKLGRTLDDGMVMYDVHEQHMPHHDMLQRLQLSLHCLQRQRLAVGVRPPAIPEQHWWEQTL
jgi:hypothetical protein